MWVFLSHFDNFVSTALVLLKSLGLSSLVYCVDRTIWSLFLF